MWHVLPQTREEDPTVDLPVTPPVVPMLAVLARELPVGDHVYEPKWDGFRCIAFVDGDEVDLRSRHDRPLGRYFPEVVAALRGLRARLVIDGELIVLGAQGFDFPGLMARLHPTPSRVERLAVETPATFIGFDLLAAGDTDLTGQAFVDRRVELERALSAAGARVLVTPATDDVATARGWLAEYQGGGIDGVVVKRRDLRYAPGKRAMIKVKLERTAECVVAGMRLRLDELAVASLLLGLYDAAGALLHVGVASSFTAARRAQLFEELRPHACALDEHPWAHGFALEGGPMGRLRGAAGKWTPAMPLDWVPLRPEVVGEFGYDQVDGHRFRHPARFLRWRPDRDPSSCRLDQLEVTGPPPQRALAP